MFSCPIRQFKPINPLEVFCIISDKRQVIGHGAGCDDQIEVIQPASRNFQLRLEQSEYFR